MVFVQIAKQSINRATRSGGTISPLPTFRFASRAGPTARLPTSRSARQLEGPELPLVRIEPACRVSDFLPLVRIDNHLNLSEITAQFA